MLGLAREAARVRCSLRAAGATPGETGCVDPSTPDADALMAPGHGASAAALNYAPAIAGHDALAAPSDDSPAIPIEDAPVIPSDNCPATLGDTRRWYLSSPRY